MTSTTLTPAIPGAQLASAPVCRAPGAGVITQPAGAHDDGGVVGHARTNDLDDVKTSVNCAESGVRIRSLERRETVENDRFESGPSSTPTIIDRTWTGRHELQVLRLPCAAHEHGKRCPYPATTVIGVAGFVQDRDDERRGAMFCAVHGQERLRAMEPMRIAEVAS